MINKDDLIKSAKKQQLDGARIDIFKFDRNNYELKFIKDFSYNFSNNNNVKIEKDDTIVRVDQVIELDEDFADLDYYVSFSKEDDKDVVFSNINVKIFLRHGNYSVNPYKEFKLDEDDKLIEYGKVSSKVLDFELSANISLEENKHDIYNDFLSVGIDKEDCYIHIVNYSDGTLPTILLSDRMLDKDDVYDQVFSKSTFGIYNSYFHPHQFKKIQEKVFPDVVFGSPDGIVKNIKFDESKIKSKDYWNSDGVYGTFDDKNKTVKVSFQGLPIAEYPLKDQNNMDNLFLISYSKDILKNQEPDELVKYDDIKDKFKLPCTPESSGIFNVYKSIDSGILYINEDGTQMIHEVDNVIENFFVTSAKNQKIKTYMILKDNHMLSINTTIDADVKELCYNNFTNNRNINVSRDGNNIIYLAKDGSCWITTNKNNDIIGTNLPISGEIIPYNIYGIPVRF